LVAAGCVAADEEADELAAAAPDRTTLETWLRRREEGEPLAWITGKLTFCGRTLHVAPGVYVPRLQSEELAFRAAGLLPDGGFAVDLCTGAGAVAAHLMDQVPTAAVVGIDIDVQSAICARSNGVPVIAGDLDGPLRAGCQFDVVTAVAPYVPTSQLRLLPSDVQRYEPRSALDGGDDGLDLVRRVVAASGRLLRPGAWLLLELGGTQDQALAPSLAAAGFDRSEPWWDEDGDLRGLGQHGPLRTYDRRHRRGPDGGKPTTAALGRWRVFRLAAKYAERAAGTGRLRRAVRRMHRLLHVVPICAYRT
jgi:release factor glutamine methyltransferase